MKLKRFFFLKPIFMHEYLTLTFTCSALYCRNNEDEDSLEFTSKNIPSCLTYIQGGITQLVPRITPDFPDQDRQHIHRKSMKGKRSSAKAKRPRSSRISNQVLRKSSRSCRNVTVVAETNECAGSEEALNSSMNKTFVKKNEDSPLNVKKTSKMTLEKELFQKKFKGLHVPEPPHLVVRTSRFSTGKKVRCSMNIFIDIVSLEIFTDVAS